MLTGAQSWRKLSSRSGNRHRRRHDQEYERYVSKSKEEEDPPPLQTISVQNPSSSAVNAATVKSSLDAPKSSAGTVRKIRFNPVIRVCLVPCRADFRNDFYLLFWDKEDYQIFKEDALRELRAHWSEHRTSVKEAIYQLYQPQPLDEVNNGHSLLAHVDSMRVLPAVNRTSGATVGSELNGKHQVGKEALNPTIDALRSVGSSISNNGMAANRKNGVINTAPPGEEGQHSDGSGISVMSVTGQAEALCSPSPISIAQKGAPGHGNPGRGSASTVSSTSNGNTSNVGGAESAGVGLLTLLASPGADPISPLHSSKDNKDPPAAAADHSNNSNNGNTSGASITTALSEERALSVVIDAAASTPPIAIIRSADGAQAAGQGASTPSMSKSHSGSSREGRRPSGSDGALSSLGSSGSAHREGGGSVLLLMLDQQLPAQQAQTQQTAQQQAQSPCSSVSSFETPILIC